MVEEAGRSDAEEGTDEAGLAGEECIIAVTFTAGSALWPSAEAELRDLGRRQSL